MKKYLKLFVFAILALVMVTGCNVSVSSGNEANSNKNANVEEQVLVDQSGIKITLKSITYDYSGGPVINVLVENNSDEDVIASIDKASINGFMVHALLSAPVSVGKKVNDKIYLYQSELDDANITTIKDVKLTFDVYEDTSYNDLFFSTVSFSTDATNYVQKNNINGKLILDRDGVKIYLLGHEGKNEYYGESVKFYIENNTSGNICVQARKESVNGYMLDSIFSTSIDSNMKAIDTMDFFLDDFEDNEIDKIETLELQFDVFDDETYDDIFLSDVIKIEF